MIDAADDCTRGARTLVQTLFRKTEVEPNRIFGSFCKTDQVADGFHDFTFVQLTNAVDACSWHIKARFGESSTFEPLLYLGIEDFRYTIVLYAAIKCGYKILLINPKYPLNSILTIMEKVECSKVLYSSELLGVVESISRQVPNILMEEMASQLHWLSSKPQRFPFDKTWENSKDDPIIVLHSSGTTGAPKPITYSNAWMAVQDQINSAVTLSEAFNGGFTYSQFPQCHFGGILFTNVRPLLTKSAASVLGPPGNTTEPAKMALEIMKSKGVKSLAATPFLLEAIVRIPGGLQVLQGLNCVSFAGGPLRSEVGDSIVEQGVTLLSSYGSTELGSCPGMLREPKYWQWTQFQPDLHPTMEPTNDGAGTHELVFNDEGDEINRRRGTYWSLGAKSYRTKDLFVQHPTQPLLWKHFGRTDDIIVLANAGKINPIPIENAIAAHPEVAGVLVVGQNRMPASILIEPQEEVNDSSSLLESLQPYISAANAAIRQDLRIPTDMVAIIKPGGLVRGLKGQIMRKANFEAHRQIIDRMYQEV